MLVVAHLPGLPSAADASLEVSEREVRIRTDCPAARHALDVGLPCGVDAGSCVAKWSKRTSKLTLRLQKL